MNTFISQATKAGYPHALVLDFLDALGHGRWQAVSKPTLDALADYAADEESAYDAQVRWDAQFVQEPVKVGGYSK